MKKTILSIFLLLTISYIYSTDFNYEKLSETNVSGYFDTWNIPIYNEPYIYFGSRYGLQTFLIHENGDLERVNILPIIGNVRGVIRKGNFIYLASWNIENDSSTLYKIDLNNPECPEIVNEKHADNENYSSLMKFCNQIVLLQTIQDQECFTFINPETLEEISHLQIFIFSDTFEISDSLFAVFNHYNQGENRDYYNVYSVENINNVQLVGSLSFPVQENEESSGISKKIEDNIFVKIGEQGIYIYNISDSFGVNEISSLIIPDFYNQHTGKCLRKGNFLLIPGNHCVDIVDINDLYNPVFVERKDFDFYTGLFPNPLVDTGNYLYLKTPEDGILKLTFDNNDLESFGFYKNLDLFSADKSYIYNNKLIIKPFRGGLYVFNINSPQNPILESRILSDIRIVSAVKFISNNRLILLFRNQQNELFLAKYNITDIDNPVLLYEIPINYDWADLIVNPNEADHIIYLVGKLNNQYGAQILKYDLFSDEEGILLFSFYQNKISYHSVSHGFFKNNRFYLYFTYPFSQPQVFTGFEENTPEYIGQTSEINYSNIGEAKYDEPYLKIFTYDSNASQTIHYYNIFDLNLEELFTTKSNNYNSFSLVKNDLLFSAGNDCIHIYDLHDCSQGLLNEKLCLQLNSFYPTFTTFERDGINYLYVIQAECISVFSYNITENGDININPLNKYAMRNYPNPFHSPSNRGSGTTISFDLPKSGDVDLTIYNIKGQKVKTLTNEKYPKGKHSLIWNGKNDKNQDVSSGVYFYKLNVDGKDVNVKKCLLMK